MLLFTRCECEGLFVSRLFAVSACGTWFVNV